MSLYENLGFNNHPFAKTNADEEPNLPDYFVPPPYFEAIVGDPLLPNASVVLAPRGSGKTAQRRMLETVSIESQFLAVTYDRFEFGAGETADNITLPYHLRNILTRIIVAFLSYVSEYPDLIKNLSKNEKKQLSLFVHTYIGDLTGDRLQELLKELKSLPEKFREFWRKNVGFMESVVNFILKTYELEKIDLPDVRHEEKRLNETYKYQLEAVLQLVRKLGFKSIYVLLDRPDETEHTGNNPESTYRLIKPLIKDLELLGLEGYGFKFFLWDQIEKYYREDARPDRIPQYRLKWTRSSLEKVLSSRLQAFSDKKISRFQDIMERHTGFDADEVICLLSNGSPRNMIRICERILAVQAEKKPDATIIDFSSFDIGILEFCETLVTENYGDVISREIQRVGRELFTTNFVANDIFKISANGARNKVTAWTKVGLVKQVGTVTVPPATRPVFFYCIVDPLAVRLLHRTISIDKFLEDRWLSCENCETDNLSDINLYPNDNVPLCRECGRELV